MDQSLTNITCGLYAETAAYRMSDYADGSSEALRRRVEAAIDEHRTAAGLPRVTGRSTRGGGWTEIESEAPADTARKMYEGADDFRPNYFIIALSSQDVAEQTAGELQKLFDQELGADAPVVLGITVPNVIRFAVKG